MNAMEEKMIELVKGGGMFVNTKVGMYRATKKLTADELGIGQLPKEALSLGTMKLLPESICPELKHIRQIESKVNSLVNLHTFQFEGLGNYLKNSKSEEFSLALQELKQEFYDAVDAFMNVYGQRIIDSQEYWGGKANALRIDKYALQGAVVKTFLEFQQVREKFKFIVTYIKMPSPATEAWENAEAEFQELSADFVKLSIQQLREEAHTAMSAMGESMASGKWNQKTLNKASKILDRIQDMQLVEDDELIGKIKTFKADFLNIEAKDYKDNTNAFAELRDGIRTATEDLKQMAVDDVSEVINRQFDIGSRKIAF